MNLSENSKGLTLLAENYAQHLNTLIELLELEQSALKDRNFEIISNCTEQKEPLLIQLEQLDAQRLIFEQQAEPLEAKEIHNFFNKNVASLLKKCSDINSVNGGIVAISKQFNQRMLNIILGAGPEEDNLYNAEGNNSRNNLKQVFAKI
ncbi:MAG: flagellar biosynthesis/type III secretory pathway chaperone [Planctomycetota bacterium]|jgi:flagellar biosynthesis/type III secretory pathway chaperone